MRFPWLVLLLAGCGGPRDAPPAEAGNAPWRQARVRQGDLLVRWRPAGGTLPWNEYFDLEVELAEDSEPVTGAEVFVSCRMPAHGHGMNVEPRAREEGDGRYRVEGMLLHMTGDWVLGIDVVRDGVASSVSFPLTLE